MATTNTAIPTEGLRGCWLLIVDRHRWGNRRHVDLNDIDITHRTTSPRWDDVGNDLPPAVNGEQPADKRRLSLAKKLMECDEVRAIEALFRDATDWLFRNGLPSFIRPGIYRIPPGLISTVEQKLREFKARLNDELVPAACAAYPTRVREGLAALGDLGNENDYPHVDDFRSCWGLGWRWVSVGVPDELKSIDYDLWKIERDKEAKQIRKAAEGIRVLLRQTALTIIRQLHAKLGPRDDGKKRVLRATALDDLTQFVSAFNFRDVTNDRELFEVISQIHQLARGVNVPQLRSDDELRARVERETSRLEGHLDRLVVEAPTRRLRVRKPSEAA
ncbi:hypothetical protein LCGC14_1813720 [marine sediment metagenome]|uniref:Uncharacterized protein n=1 Tax=marine sediment metagenome TaxID=412755 RepID=A0A0F9J0R2_9ZZZZ